MTTLDPMAPFQAAVEAAIAAHGKAKADALAATAAADTAKAALDQAFADLIAAAKAQIAPITTA